MSNPAGTRKKIEAIDSMLFVGAEDIAKLDRTIAALTAERDALKAELAEMLIDYIGMQKLHGHKVHEEDLARYKQLTGHEYGSEGANG